MLQLTTTRFGTIQVAAEDVFQFPQGIIGFEECQRWMMLADASNAAVGWLQSATRPEVAVAVVSPKRFVAGYRFRVGKSQLLPIELADTHQAFVMAIVSKHYETLTVNLKAPLIFNLERRLGCQVIAADEQPVQYPLISTQPQLRRTA